MRGRKTGGRTAGTPNKATSELKDFLARVFGRAYTEKRILLADGRILRKKTHRLHELRGLEDRLVDQIVTLTLDPKILVRLLEYQAGKPVTPIGLDDDTKDLAALIAGVKAGESAE